MSGFVLALALFGMAGLALGFAFSSRIAHGIAAACFVAAGILTLV